MDKPAYATLNLSIQAESKLSYRLQLTLRVDKSAADAELAIPWTGPIQFDFAPLRANQLDPEAYGQQLFRNLTADAHVRDGLRQALETARALDVPLRIRLVLDPADPQLHGLRWELLRDPAQGSFLALSERILLSQALPGGDGTPLRLPEHEELRALVLIASPSDLATFGLQPLDVSAEQQRIVTALGNLPTRFLTSGSEHPPTRSALLDTLRDNYPLLVFVAHGTFVAEETYLWLERSDGRADQVRADDLVAALGDGKRWPVLTILAACDGAGRENDPDALAALGPRLVRAGAPAVIAMRGQISIAAVGSLLPTLIRELLDDGQIDRALAAARRSAAEHADWWRPTLIMRLKDGRLWTLSEPESKAYQSYRETFRRNLKTALDALRTRFTMTIGEGQPLEQLIDIAFTESRVILHGAAGSGKTSALWQVAQLARERKIIPIMLNFKNWTLAYGKELMDQVLQSQTASFDTLLRVAVGNLSSAKLASFPRRPCLVIADGLNEVAQAPQRQRILRVLENYCRQTDDTAIIVSDRVAPHGDEARQWVALPIDLLADREVNRVLTASFEPQLLGGLNERDRRLLRLPYFLEFALQTRRPQLNSAVSAFAHYLKNLLQLEPDAIERLEQAAFQAYETDRSASFLPGAFRATLGDELYNRVAEARLIRGSEGNRLQFEHQLMHDFLAASHLAHQGEPFWTSTTFDAVTFEASSREPIGTALAQLTHPHIADRFLERVHDWSWSAPLIAMIQAERAGSVHYSRTMAVAVLAAVAEKRFDPVRSTSARAHELLNSCTFLEARGFQQAHTNSS